jgi:hypothetical protein
MYRAGDTVKHTPSGEEWTLACDEEDGRVVPAGWPESTGAAYDCTLIRAATNIERLEMLRRVAFASNNYGASYRTSLALEQFTKERLGGHVNA